MVKKVLFITSNQGIEHDELTEPLNFLKSKGFEVIHAAEKNEDVATVKGYQSCHPIYAGYQS